MASGILGRGTLLQTYSSGWALDNQNKLVNWHVTSISGPGAVADQLDVTAINSVNREYIAGLIDPGEITFAMFADFGSGISRQSKVFDQFEAGDEKYYRILFPVEADFTHADQSATLALPVSKTITMVDVDAVGKVIAPGMSVTGAFMGPNSVVGTVNTSANTFTLTADSDFPTNVGAANSTLTFGEKFCSFKGSVTQAEYSVPIDGAISINVTIKVLGEINWPGSAA